MSTPTILNPFPDYTVARLADDASIAAGSTVVTPPIRQARERVAAYVAQLTKRAGSADAGALIVAVRGDFGTGKTHLLLDAAAELRRLAGGADRVTVLRFTCVEADPLTWFRTKIGPELDQPFLSDITTKLLAKAGKVVATKTPLTEAASEALENNPAFIRELLRRDHLNAAAVEREFDAQVRAAYPGIPDSVRVALSGLLWSETDALARQWLSGRALSARDRELLRIPEAVASADEIAAIIGAIAAMHSTVGQPIAVLIDELEHFTRYDRAQGAWGNITWLKRLLEALGRTASLVFVAGHWSAWETAHDYLDRLGQLSPVDLLKLSGEDVLKIMKARVDPLPTTVTTTTAQGIAESGDGNMRRILTLCRALFRQSNGFSRALPPEEIRATADELAQHLPVEQALDRARQILEARGTKVRLDDRVDGIQFDLVAYAGEAPAVVMSAKHAVHQVDLHDSARLFLTQLNALAKRFPGVVGYLLADGNVDDEFLRIVRSVPESRLRAFDLTQRDVMTRLLTALDPSSQSPEGAAARAVQLERASAGLRSEIAAAVAENNTQLAEQLRQQQGEVARQLAGVTRDITGRNAELERQLAELEKKRTAEMEDLRQRLEALAMRAESPRAAEVVRSEGEDNPRLHVMYQELVRPPSLIVRLRTIGPSFMIAPAMLIFAGLFLALALPVESRLERLAYTSYSALFASAAAFFIWRQLGRVDSYFEFAARLLREIYVRAPSSELLVTTDRILRDALDEQGPIKGRGVALARISAVVPPWVAEAITHPPEPDSPGRPAP